MQSLEQLLISLRRDLHRHPESGWTEFYTSARIIETLTSFGIPVAYGRTLHSESHMFGMPNNDAMKKTYHDAVDFIGNDDLLKHMQGGYTGCMAEITGALPGKTTVVRVDIDACELTECKDTDHFPAANGFASLIDGRMHACGHDAHAAIGVGLAISLYQHREILHGTVRILFQPAEEGLRGAMSMVQAGLLKNCDRLIGLHVGIKDLSLGTIAVSSKDFLSSTKLDIFFHGKAAHAGICPELGRNAFAAAAKASLELLDLPNRFDGICRVNIGTFQSISGRNVIPAEAWFTMETRADHPERNKALQKAAESIIFSTAKEYSCTAETCYMGGSNAAECDLEFAEEISAILASSSDVKEILPSVSFGGGEDITTMMQYVQDRGGQATELLLGMPLIAPHHSNRFDIDERVIPFGVNVLTEICLGIK